MILMKNVLKAHRIGNEIAMSESNNPNEKCIESAQTGE